MSEKLLEVIEEAKKVIASHDGPIDSSTLVKALEDKNFASSDVSGGLALGLIEEKLELDWDFNMTVKDADTND